MFTQDFWKRAAERAIKTFAQALVASGIVVGATGHEWQAAVIAAAIAAVLSVLTSVAGIGIGDAGTPSLVGEPAIAVGGRPDSGLGSLHPGSNFDTTDFGPPLIDPKDVA